MLRERTPLVEWSLPFCKSYNQIMPRLQQHSLTFANENSRKKLFLQRLADWDLSDVEKLQCYMSRG